MKILLEGGHFFEGARWHDGHWWVSDLYAPHVLKITPEGKAQVVAEVPGRPSGLGWLPDSTLLIVSMQDRKILKRTPDGALSLHADLAPLSASYANDMVTDRRGHSYVGNFGFDLYAGEAPRQATLVHVHPDGRAEIAADDLCFPNGAVVTADGRTLIVAESFGGCLTAFTIGDDGRLSDRRLWATLCVPPPRDSLVSLATAQIVPDGCSIDHEGLIWVADAATNRVLRVAEGKGIVDEVRLPNDMIVFSCAIGGADGRSLMICASPDYHDDRRIAKAESVLYVETL